MKLTSNKISSDIFYLVLFSIITGITIVLLWASNKGLDLSDESFYINSILYSTSTNNNSTFFYLIYQKSFGFLGYSIQTFRLTRLILSILSCIVLAKGIINYLKEKKYLNFNLLEIFAFVLIGMFLSYSLLPQTISYNSFSQVLFNFIIGIWLINSTQKKLLWLFYQSVIGFLLGILLIVKFPNAILLTALLIVGELVLFNKIEPKKIFISLFIWLIFGITSLLIFLQNPLATFSVTSELLSIPIESHSISNILKAYYENIYELMVRHRFIYPFIITSILLSYFVKSERFSKTINIIYQVIFLMYFAFYCYKTDILIKSDYNTYQLFDVYFLLIVFLIFYYLLNKKTDLKLSINKFELLLSLILILATMTGIFGTNNGITAQILIYMSLILVPVYLLIRKLPKNLFITVTLILFGCVFSQVISATVYAPYRNCYPLTKQSFYANTNSIISTTAIDKEKKDLIAQLEEIRNSKPEFLFTYSDYIGLTLLIDKKPYDHSWFSYPNHQLNCFKISKNKTSEENIIFAFTDNYPPTKELLDCLNKNRINFPDNFKLKKSITFNDCSNNGVTTKLHFFVHKSFVK